MQVVTWCERHPSFGLDDIYIFFKKEKLQFMQNIFDLTCWVERGEMTNIDSQIKKINK